MGTKNLNLMLSDELLKRIEEFRFREKFATRVDAIRWLLDFSLKQKPKRG